MQHLTIVTAVAAAYDRPNVDTDLIIPKQFLIKIDREGYGRHLFHDVRYLADGSEDPDFFLNRPENRSARILVSRENFGCGSSREHAAWALRDFGFRVVLAPSFGDIFRNNAFNCGLAPVVLPPEVVLDLVRRVEASPGIELTFDLEKKLLTGPDGLSVPFDLDEHRRRMLLEGLDAIGLTLLREEAIKAYEDSHAEVWQAALPPGRAR